MRKPKVSRTISVTRCKILIVDIESQETLQSEVDISRAPENNEKLLKLLKSRYDTKISKVVAVLSTEKLNVCYSMDESRFMELSEKLEVACPAGGSPASEI